jgi:hypothetical protein
MDRPHVLTRDELRTRALSKLNTSFMLLECLKQSLARAGSQDDGLIAELSIALACASTARTAFGEAASLFAEAQRREAALLPVLDARCRHCRATARRLVRTALLQDAGCGVSHRADVCWAREDGGEHDFTPEPLGPVGRPLTDADVGFPECP